MYGKCFDFHLQIILMQIRSRSVHQYPMNSKTATTAYDQSLNCKPEKLSLMMVILWAFSMATYTFVISFRGKVTPQKKLTGFETAEHSFRVFRQFRCLLHSLQMNKKSPSANEHWNPEQCSSWKPTDLTMHSISSVGKWGMFLNPSVWNKYIHQKIS